MAKHYFKTKVIKYLWSVVLHYRDVHGLNLVFFLEEIFLVGLFDWFMHILNVVLTLDCMLRDFTGIPFFKHILSTVVQEHF